MGLGDSSGSCRYCGSGRAVAVPLEAHAKHPCLLLLGIAWRQSSQTREKLPKSCLNIEASGPQCTHLGDEVPRPHRFALRARDRKRAGLGAGFRRDGWEGGRSHGACASRAARPVGRLLRAHRGSQALPALGSGVRADGERGSGPGTGAACPRGPPAFHQTALELGGSAGPS